MSRSSLINASWCFHPHLGNTGSHLLEMSPFRDPFLSWSSFRLIGHPWQGSLLTPLVFPTLNVGDLLATAKDHSPPSLPKPPLY